MANRKSNVLNFWETTLTAQMGDTDLTANVADLASITSPCYAIIEPDSASQREVIYFDGSFGASSLVTTNIANRYLQGSGAGSGLTHPNGSVVRIAPFSQIVDDLNDRIGGHTHTGGDDGTALDHADFTNVLANQHHNENHASRHATGQPDVLTPADIGAAPSSQGVTNGDSHDHSGGDGAQIDHAGLANLTAGDPHNQYIKTDGTRAFTGDQSMGSNQLTNVGAPAADSDAARRQDLEEIINFSEVGDLATKTGTFRFYCQRAYTIVEVEAAVGTAPTGAAVIVDVNKNGTTIFTTQSNRPQIAVSTFVDSAGGIDVSSLADGDYLTVDIDQIGSTVAGADLVVSIRLRRA